MTIKYNMDKLRQDLQVRLTGDLILGRYASTVDPSHCYSNGDYKIKCFLPGHQDDTASLSISANKFMYHCFGNCGIDQSKGDFIKLIQVMESCGFIDACKIATDMCGLPMSAYEEIEKVVDRPEIDQKAGYRFHHNLLNNDSKLKALMDARGFTIDTIKEFELGIDTYGNWTIPIYDNGKLVNVKYRSRDVNPKKSKYRSHAIPYEQDGKKKRHAYGEQRLFGIDRLLSASDDDKIIVCGGEYDAISACQVGCVGITSTTGEGSWKKEWNKLLDGKIVYVCMDNDDPGRTATKKIEKHLPSAHVVMLGEYANEGEDLTDYLCGGGDIGGLLVEKKTEVVEDITTPEEVQKQELLVGRIRRQPTYEMNPAFFVDNLGEVYIMVQCDLDCQTNEGEQELVEDTPLIISSKRNIYNVPKVDPLKLRDNPNLRALFNERWKVKSAPDYATRRWPASLMADWLSGKRDLFSNTIEVYEDIYYSIKRYSKMPRKRYRGLVALYIMGSYFYEAFDSYPYLFINGEKGSGKSTLGRVLSELGFNGEFVTNPTVAALARIVDQTKGLMVIDEIEQQTQRVQGRSEMGQVLNSGYQRGAKRVICDTENKNKPREYDIYSPKVLANIFGLNDTLQNRCITIKMQKIDNFGFSIKSPSSDKDLKKIAIKMYEIMMCKTEKVLDCYNRVKKMKHFEQIGQKENKSLKVFGRERELYNPLLAMALFVYEDSDNKKKWARPWDDLLEQLFEISNERKEAEEETPEAKLRTSLMELMEQRNSNELELNMYELVMAYKGVYVESPGHGTEKWIAKQLRKYDWCVPYGKNLKRRWVDVPIEVKDGGFRTVRKFLGIFTITRRRLGVELCGVDELDIPF